MELPLFTLIVATKPRLGQEAEWNRWYDHIHLAEVLALAGFVRASRLQGIGDVQPGRGNVAMYEIEADDDDAALAALSRLQAASLTTTDALDPDSVTFDLYRNGAWRVGPLEGEG
jgi:hypothetical protein